MADTQQIDIPGVGIVEFPSSMSDADISAAAKRLHDQANYTPDPTMQAETARAIGRSQGLGFGVPRPPVVDELGRPLKSTEPDTWWGGVGKSLKDQITHAVVGNPAVEAAARPGQSGTTIGTLSDLSALAIPDAPGAMQAVAQGARDTVGRVRVNPGAILDVKLNQPLKTLRDVVKIAPPPIDRAVQPASELAAQAARTPSAAPVYAEPAMSFPPPVENHAPALSGAALSDAERAALVKQGYTPEVIAKIEGQLQPIASHASGAAPNVPPASQMISSEGPFAEPPTAHGPTAADRDLATLARINGNGQPAVPLPMQGARVGVGAEQVGRSAGMTPTEVRLQTGPILGEAPGEASHVFPQKPLERMIDRMKALPKEGTARVDYVQAAKDPKTMAQLENLRRTLAHLGLGVGGAVGSRQLLVNGLNGDTQ